MLIKKCPGPRPCGQAMSLGAICGDNTSDGGWQWVVDPSHCGFIFFRRLECLTMAPAEPRQTRQPHSMTCVLSVAGMSGIRRFPSIAVIPGTKKPYGACNVACTVGFMISSSPAVAGSGGGIIPQRRGCRPGNSRRRFPCAGFRVPPFSVRVPGLAGCFSR